MPIPEGEPTGGVTHHGEVTPRGLEVVPRSPFFEGRFGRMFRRLPPFEPPDELLQELGAPDGPMREPARRTQNNAAIPAGYTYLGQFVDHDITFDPTSSFSRRNDPDALQNFRTPRFDLDCIYLAGRRASPFLYDKRDTAKFLLARNRARDLDLPRNSQQVALIGDPRNDESILVSQLHVGFLAFHNAVVGHLRARRANLERHALPGENVFDTAQRLVRWHYQWVVVNDLLPRIAGRQVVNRILKREPGGKRTVELDFYRPQRAPFIPVEFAVAAYRFDHSMIRPVYDLNDVITGVEIFGGARAHPLTHLGGGRRLPDGWPAKWSLFFPIGRRRPQPSRKINARLAPPLLSLPQEVAGTARPDRRSLATRNLLRGKALGLPSGQAVATAMGETPLSNAELGLRGARWSGGAPLWYYVLKEAEKTQSGTRLGGRIVAEVLLGLLGHDGTSYLNAETPWRPTRPIAPRAGDLDMGDILRFAEVA
ncbi:MAG: peroxidase family protein [Gaiellaceae bacterium]